MQPNDQLTLQVSKDLSVSAQRVFDAWTKPEELKRWWRPMDNTLTEVTNDLKEGGTLNYVFAENGLHISGEYLEVKPVERLVYSWKWEFPSEALKNATYKLTVEFENTGGGSTLRVTQENFQDEEGVKVHEEGWNKGLSDLEQYFSVSDNVLEGEQAGENGGTMATERSGGYNEAPEQVKVGGG